MEDYKYEYKSPLDTGHFQFKLTRKQHNELFPLRKIKWHTKYEYYFNEHHVILHKFTNWKAKLLLTIIFPFMFILHGFSNSKEIIREYKRMYNEKKYGSFVGDHVSSGTEKYKVIMKYIK